VAVALQRGLPHLRVLALDWRTIASDGTARAFDVAAARTGRVAVEDLRLVHVFRLGYWAAKDTPLKEKWRALNDRLAVVRAAGARCVNSAGAIAYGIEKDYLCDLAAHGIPAVRTKKVPASVTLAELHTAHDDDEYAIVKPANGECGKLVMLIAEVDENDLARLRAEADHLLLQPFAARALAGEKSLLFVGGAFAHAVIKVPSARDFRANGAHTGATIRAYDPSAAEIELARRAGAAFRYPLDAFRADLIGDRAGLELMELEVVDPGHYRDDDAHVLRMTAFYAALAGG